MSEVEFLGSLVVALAGLLGLFTALIKIIINPINELTLSIAQLEHTLTTVVENNKTLNARIDRLKRRVSELEDTEC